MAEYLAPLQDLRFLMRDVFALERVWQNLALNDADDATADAILEEAAKICETVLAPLDRTADETGCRLEGQDVITPSGYKDAYRTWREGGWCGLGGSPQYGGMGLPKSLVVAVEEMLQGAGLAFGLAPMLTTGACVALEAHASDALKERFLPPMLSGEWSGAMDLTEPHCGTDLGLIRTKAVPQKDGSYHLSGTKIFITWGEHDMADNIVHLVLAKLPDAPPGSRGISMFLVPKILVNDDGSLGARNSVSCGALEKKMGIKGSATCVMNYDGATGWLVGEPHRGLAAMFTMMNYERLGVGLQGVAAAEASYQTAVVYARERLQSRSPRGPHSPDKEADPLLVHADVRRMLLTMRAYNEAGRAFYFYVAQWLDIAKYSNNAVEREHADKLVALLTPVAKAFLTDVAMESALQGQQVLGGHGYIREWGQEQRVRDVRITQIYEGTNGIQAMDLIGRKTLASRGALLEIFAADIEAFLDAHLQSQAVMEYAPVLRDKVATLRDVTQALLQASEQDPDAAGAAATAYLHYMGYVSYAYMWLRMAVAAETSSDSDSFRKAKGHTCRFYFDQLLPQTLTLEARMRAGSHSTMAMPADHF